MGACGQMTRPLPVLSPFAGQFTRKKVDAAIIGTDGEQGSVRIIT